MGETEQREKLNNLRDGCTAGTTLEARITLQPMNSNQYSTGTLQLYYNFIVVFSNTRAKYFDSFFFSVCVDWFKSRESCPSSRFPGNQAKQPLLRV